MVALLSERTNTPAPAAVPRFVPATVRLDKTAGLFFGAVPVGQRFVPGALDPYAYNRIPYDLRQQYGLNPYGNYYYASGYLYGADPRTMLVRQVINALLHR